MQREKLYKEIYSICHPNHLHPIKHLIQLRDGARNKRISDAASHYVTPFRSTQELPRTEFLAQVSSHLHIHDQTRNRLESEVQQVEEELESRLTESDERARRKAKKEVRKVKSVILHLGAKFCQNQDRVMVLGKCHKTYIVNKIMNLRHVYVK